MISASETAEEKLKEVIFHRLSDVGLGFRVREDADQSSGKTFSIKLDYKQDNDQVMELNGLCLFLDPACAAGLKDYELDYQEEPAGFCLKRPSDIADAVVVREGEVVFGEAS